MDDKRIVDLFFERAETALTELSEKYGKLCFAAARKFLQSEEDVQECINDTYLAVWNAIPPARPDPLLPFVLRILRNICIDRVRYNNAEKRGKYVEIVEELDLRTMDTPEQIYDAKLLSRYIDEFLAGLNRTNRLLFVRRYWYFDSFEDLAAATGLRPGAVRTRLSRLRTKLIGYLGEQGVYLF